MFIRAAHQIDLRVRRLLRLPCDGSLRSRGGGDGFVMRYDTGGVDDGLPPGEGAFLACSFWLVDVYVLKVASKTQSDCSSG
jgi:hypothetical protein